jgi:long-chain acyl-CoA synthetase
MNIASAFGQSARKQPGKTALYWGEREYSYAQLWRQTRLVAGDLRGRLGVKRGMRVGLWLKNCPEFVPAWFGILQAGAVAVPINNFLKTDEVNYILGDAGIDVVVTDAELGAQHRALEAVRPKLKLLTAEELAPGWEQGGAGARGWAGPRVEASALAALIYTSGTTGRPKGAMLTHGNLLHNVESCRIVLQTVAADRFAVLLPMFHSYMLTVGMLLPLLVGGSIVLVKSLHPLRNVWEEILRREATVLPAIPQFYRGLVSAPVPGRLPVRVCISGSAPLPVQVLREFEAKFGIPLIEGYGLSEASPVVAKNPLDATRKPGSIGLPIPNVEISIQDETGRQLGDYQTGELCVRGGNVMLGYWNQPEETARTLRNGWLLTGDIGHRDRDGYYFITDRKKDMLLVNGNNVYPREIEEVLQMFPGVKEAAVIGKPDARKGEQPVAFVAANDGVELEERALLQFVRKRLADYKVPRKVVFVGALPRNATGKVLKTELRQMPVGE